MANVLLTPQTFAQCERCAFYRATDAVSGLCTRGPPDAFHPWGYWPRVAVNYGCGEFTTSNSFVAGGGGQPGVTESYGNDGSGVFPPGTQMVHSTANGGNVVAAINAAAPGTTIGLYPEDYTEDIWNLKNIDKGRDPTKVVTIQGQTGTRAIYCDMSGCSGIWLKYVSLINTDPGRVPMAMALLGYYNSGIDHCTISDIDYSRCVFLNQGNGTSENTQVSHCDIDHCSGFSIGVLGYPGYIKDLRILNNRITNYRTDGALLSMIQTCKIIGNLWYFAHDFGDHNDMCQFGGIGQFSADIGDHPYFDPITGRNWNVWIEGNVGIQLVGQAPGVVVQGIPFMNDGSNGAVLIRKNCSWGLGANGISLAGILDIRVDGNFTQSIVGDISGDAPMSILGCTTGQVVNNQCQRVAISPANPNNGIQGIGPDGALDPSQGNNTIIPPATSNADTGRRDAFIKANGLPHTIPGYPINLAGV